MTTSQKRPLIQINIFTPKPGMMDAFVAAQLQGLPSLGNAPGARGSQWYRANDDRNVVAVAYFDDEDALRRFTETAAFAKHRQRLLPLIEGTAPAFYTLIYTGAGSEQSS